MRDIVGWISVLGVSFVGWLGTITRADAQEWLGIIGAVVFILGGIISAVCVILTTRKNLRGK